MNKQSSGRGSDKEVAVVAIDPGQDKCGVAALSGEGQVLWRAIATPHRAVDLALRWASEQAIIVVGRGTGRKSVLQMLRDKGIRAEVVEERDTTIQARALYWQANPPRGWRRLIPRGLLVPPEPIDDWAAVAIARRFLSGKEAGC